MKNIVLTILTLSSTASIHTMYNRSSQTTSTIAPLSDIAQSPITPIETLTQQLESSTDRTCTFPSFCSQTEKIIKLIEKSVKEDTNTKERMLAVTQRLIAVCKRLNYNCHVYSTTEEKKVVVDSRIQRSLNALLQKLK